MKWNFFVAARYFRSRRTSTIILSISSIAIGVAALMIVISVMNGFQLGFIEDILAINSFHIRIKINDYSDIDKITSIAEGRKGILSVIAMKDYQSLGVPKYEGLYAVQIKGIDSSVYEKDVNFRDYLEIKLGEFDIKEPYSIVIGQRLAQDLQVTVGDSIKLLDIKNSFYTGYDEYRVTGIFKSGNQDYDSLLGFIGYKENSEYLHTEINSYVCLKLENKYDDLKIISWLKKQLPDYSISSWREFNKTFFGVLKMEKLVMFLLMGLIFILVGMNIYNSLRRSVYEKREEIGLMLAVGADQKHVKRVFILEGSFIGFAGAFLGLLLGLFCGIYMNEIVIFVLNLVNGLFSILEKILLPIVEIHLPRVSIFSVYYMDTLPVKIILGEIIIIFLFGFFSAAFAAVKASGRVSEIKPAEIIKEE